MNAFNKLSPILLEVLQREGITGPTEIQRLAIPVILTGKDTLLIAPTGTGKTEAAYIPVFELFTRFKAEHAVRGTAILYITPLRALNRDIFRRLFRISEALGFEVQVRHGDTEASVRRLQALKPPAMLITTPETLQAILPGRKMGEHLKGVRWVIVDEIHELSSDERGVQLAVALERLQERCLQRIQRVGLSATIGEPETVAHFLTGGGEAVVLRASSPKDVSVWVENPSSTRDDEKTAEDLLISPGSVARIRRLLAFMDTYRSMLIFTNTREHAEALASRMLCLKPDLKVGVHHGSLSRETRAKTEVDIREGRLQAVVCTSSLELGVDIGILDFVAHHMSPRQTTRLVHRIGRSGHVVHGKSLGCIISAWPDDALESAVLARRMMVERLEKPKLHFNALDVLAHQVAGLLLDWGRLKSERVFNVVKRAFPYKDLSLEEFTATIQQLEKTGIIYTYADTVAPRRGRLHRYYFENVSMIPDVKQYHVYDFLGRRSVGVLDQEFVGRNGREGVEFIMRGHTWRILSIDDEKRLVNVEPVYGSLGAIPSWEGEIIPVPMDVAVEVGALRGEVAKRVLTCDNPTVALNPYPLDAEAKERVVDYVKEQVGKGFEVPTDKRIVVEGYERFIVFHACFGDMVNEALGRTLAALLSSRLGVPIGVQVDPYRIAFIAEEFIHAKDVVNEVLSLKPGDVTSIVKATLPETTLFAWKLWHVAKRFGVVEREADYRLNQARALASMLKDTPVFAETLREITTEKLDLENTERVISMVNAGEITVVLTRGREVHSPMALPIIDRIVPHDLLRPAFPTRDVTNLVKERLLNERMKFICLSRNDWEGVYPVRLLPDRVQCLKCHSTMVTVTVPQDFELRRIIEKHMAKVKLTAEEERRWLTAWKAAGIIQTYGRLGATVLAGRGVGPTTAIRILRRYYRSEDERYFQILKAEREYIRTKPFWD